MPAFTQFSPALRKILFQANDPRNNPNTPEGDLNHGSAWGGFLPFLTTVATAGAATPFVLGGNDNKGANNPMEIPNLGGGSSPSVGGFNFPGVNLNIGGGGSNGSSNSNNDYLKWLLPLLAGITGGLDNRAQKTTSTPTFDPQVTPLRNTSIDQYMKLLTEDPDLKGYTASQTGEINRQSDVQKRLAEETAASKGVYGPAVATSLNNVDANRFANITKLKQGVPLLSRQLKSDALTSVGNFVNQNKGTQVDTSGNVLGGAFGGTTELLAYLYGLGRI